MTRLGGSDGGAHGFKVAQLADDDDVSILAQGAFQGTGEIHRVRADLALADKTATMGEDELDRVLNGDDIGGALCGDLLSEGAKRRGLAGARHASDENEAIADSAEALEGFAMAKFAQRWDGIGDMAEVGLDVAHDIAGIAPEAPEVFDLDGKVELPLVLEFGALAFFEDIQDKLTGIILVEDFVCEGLEHTVQSHAGRGIDAEVQVGAAAFNNEAEVLNEVVMAHGGKGVSFCFRVRWSTLVAEDERTENGPTFVLFVKS